jgi:hypothetical protein
MINESIVEKVEEHDPYSYKNKSVTLNLPIPSDASSPITLAVIRC